MFARSQALPLIVEFLIRKNASKRKIRESEEKFRTFVTNTEEIVYMILCSEVFFLTFFVKKYFF